MRTPFDTQPLSPGELHELLECEEQWGPSPEVERRLLGRLSATIGVPLAMPGPPPIPAEAVGSAANAGAATAGQTAAVGGAAAPIVAPSAAVGIGAGGAAAAGAMALVKPLLVATAIGIATAVTVGQVAMNADDEPARPASVSVPLVTRALDAPLDTGSAQLEQATTPISAVREKPAAQTTPARTRPEPARLRRRSVRSRRRVARRARTEASKMLKQTAERPRSVRASSPVEAAIVEPMPDDGSSDLVPVDQMALALADGPAYVPPLPTGRSTLARERRLLDAARSALVRGDTKSAARRLVRYQKRFARGTLIEEAHALRVRVLFAAGWRKQANSAARSFLSRYPDSLLRVAVEHALDAPGTSRP